MKSKAYNLSIAQTTNNSNSSTSCLSHMSSPRLRQSSLSDIEKDLKIKQEKLTESLVRYSIELSRKIPFVAQRWTFENSRLNKAVSKKNIARRMFASFSRESTELENLKIAESRALLAESAKDAEEEKLEDLKKKLRILRKKKKDYDECVRNMNLLNNEKNGLEEKLRNIREYAEVSLKNLRELENKKKELKKIESLFLNRLEEIYTHKEDILIGIDKLEKAKAGVLSQARGRNQEDEKSLKVYLNELARGELILKDRNFKRKQELRDARERIEETFRVNKIERRCLENKKKKLGDLKSFIYNKMEELKKVLGKTQRK